MGSKAGSPEVSNLKITGYNVKAVKILFDYLNGFGEMMESVDNFEELADMIRFCDFYGIQGPVALLSHKIKTLKLTMDNVLACIKACAVLVRLPAFTHLENILSAKCKTFAAANFGSWQPLMTFFADKCEGLDSINLALEFFKSAGILTGL